MTDKQGKQGDRGGFVMGVAVAVGVGLGVALGTALDSLAIGVAIGAGVGVALGSVGVALDAKRSTAQSESDGSDE